jgi:hypothetical protein
MYATAMVLSAIDIVSIVLNIAIRMYGDSVRSSVVGAGLVSIASISYGIFGFVQRSTKYYDKRDGKYFKK